MTTFPLLSRDQRFQPPDFTEPFEPHLVDEPSVSGRLIPREEPQSEPCDVRFHGGAYGIRAGCEPCNWKVWIDGGHSLSDLARLVREHAGVARVADAERDTPGGA